MRDTASNHANEGRAKDERMGVEDPFDRLGEVRPLGRDDAMRLAPAEPEPALFIEVAEVSHAMGDVGVGRDGIRS